MKLCLYVALLYGIIQGIVCMCSWPTVFQNSIWLDSDRGTLTFNDSHMTGWEVTFQSTTLSEWECYHVNDSTSASFKMIIRATGTFEEFTVQYTPFLCLEMTQVTNYSYSYYQQANEEERVNFERYLMFENYAEAVSQNNLPTETDICSPSNGPGVNEYHFLVKNDQTNSAVQNCSSTFFGIYSYVLTDSSNMTFCGTGNEEWNVCNNNAQMTFDYSICTTEVAYSSSGTVDCVYSLDSDSFVLQTVLNRDVVLSADNYRFTCFMSILNGDSSLTVSQAPGSCTRTQVPGSVPMLSNTTAVGYTMTLTPKTNGLCPITTTSTTTTSTPTTTTTTTTTSTTTTTTTTTTTSTTTTTTPTTTTSTTTTTTPTTTSTTTTTTPTSTTTTTTPTTTTTTTATVQTTTKKPDNTLSYIAIGLVAAVFLILLLVIGIFVIRKFCCKKEKPPTPLPPIQTPDLIIEAMPHTIAGKEGLPVTYKNGPTGTVVTKEHIEKRETIFFPEVKNSNFMMSIPQSTSVQQKSVNPSKVHGSFSSEDSSAIRNSRYTGFLHSESSRTYTQTRVSSQERNGRNHSDTKSDPNTSLMDTIIMDERVNYALLYHPRMIQAKEEWDKEHTKQPDEIVSRTAVPLAITQNTADSINNSYSDADNSVSGLSSIHQDQSRDTNKHQTKHISRISDTGEEDIIDSPNDPKETDLSAEHDRNVSHDRNTMFTDISSGEFKTSSPIEKVQEVQVSPCDITSGDITIPVSPHDTTIDTITFTGDYGRPVAP